ncbi:MAG: gamma-glutamyl-gamma-aminobutyrate hydrolase family protein [Pseudoxanthomonas sp.]
MEAQIPVVGVISCGREVEGEPAQATKHRYLEAVSHFAGAAPLMIPTNQPPGNATAIVARLDALLLTGSNSNIAPARYGSSHAVRQPVDAGRDRFSTALITVAVSAGKPVLGVCRGLQEINVAFGGTLRDLRDDTGVAPVHHAPDGVSLELMFGHLHELQVISGTTFAAIVGTAGFSVNSVHYQAIDRLGSGLAIAATSADGVIEAIYSTSTAAPVLAVQWHPEWRPDGRPHDLALWKYFGEIARTRSLQPGMDIAR